MSVKKYYFIGKNQLFPICRSITGAGIRKSLKIIKNNFPKLRISNVKSGKKVFDWKIPDEWNIKSATIKDKNNNILVDFKDNNLHVIGYSVPVNKYLKKKSLLKKLHSIKNKPNAIPYMTSYYKRNWGFCVTEKQKKFINKNYNKNDKFKVSINSSFNKNGYLSFGEYFIKGKSKKEILLTTYLCHPSMANNELSGPLVSMLLINHYKKKKLPFSIRFIFIPETIGSITYLSKNLNHLKKNMIAGFNLTCIGDERKYGCMLSKYKNSISDKALLETYKKLNIKFKEYPFIENGSDERQFNYPGIDLPVASIFRSKYGTYPEYHTSLDNFDLVTEKGLTQSLKFVKALIDNIQKKIIPQNLILCEPQMSKRGLYPTLSNLKTMGSTKKIMNFLQFADGKNDLKEISKIINLNFKKTSYIYRVLKNKKLLV